MYEIFANWSKKKLILWVDIISPYIDFLYDLVLPYFTLVNVISNKYILLTIIVSIYLSYNFTTEKIVYSSYTSDNYNDLILSKLSKSVINQSKALLHIVNNKILHPITIFLQNL